MLEEWIKVEDSLPDKFIDVLVWSYNINGKGFEKDEEYAGIDRYCVWTDDTPPSFRTDRFYGKVTHWMPLPKPPLQ